MRHAAPTCHHCPAPVQRVEHAWHRDEDGTWRLVAHMVCETGHRVLVRPFPDTTLEAA